MTKWQWLLLQLTRRLWVRAALIGLLGIGAAIVATLAETLVPWNPGVDISADAVNSILTIIASSMLTVTTFSLSVMTSAYRSATSNATPRATRLLIQDHMSQNVLSTFIGSFLFSIVGIVVLKTGAYGPQGRAVLFGVTILVIALIVVSLLKWIDYLTQLGRVEKAADRVEQATRQAISLRLSQPFLGGQPLRREERVPETAKTICSNQSGYVQHIDMQHLHDCVKEAGARVYLGVVPGHFVFDHAPLARIVLSSERPDGEEADEQAMEAVGKALKEAITIGQERSFDQDPRFGFCVLGEIATRALSPGINDSGTAIDIIGRLTRLLGLWSDEQSEAVAEVEFPDIYVPPIEETDLFEDAFMQIARDGASHIEIQLRLRKALRALGQTGSVAFRQAAKEQAALALKRANAALGMEEDKARLGAVTIE
ncbi:DUF2254 domain-containing protein [Cohaesibacter marisflavi]|uniref:DUF2254 domain-containing protein n=1 Tax=Cohaesibacter marisflavi TaxID=655353 RepID=UPI0029C73326|nr:DUF2254 domain-containing protein [Cohaesibacter marisflavi]